MSLSGNVIAITGASSDIGEATARLPAARGATVVEGLRQQSTDGVVRTTSISPGFVRTELDASIDDPALRGQIRLSMDEFGVAPEAVARAVTFAIEQRRDVEIGDITIRSTVQG